MTHSPKRQELCHWLNEAIDAGARKHLAAKIIGISVRTFERWHPKGSQEIAQDKRPTAVRPKPMNKLSSKERAMVLKICNQKAFSDLPPSQIVPKLADRGIYIASESSFYRILKEHKQLTHRGRAKEARKRAISTHIATAPNQVWMWDITYLPSQIKGKYFYLYQIEDLFSRFGVAWEIHECEHAQHASLLMSQAVFRENCHTNPPILHSDNGSVMKSLTLCAKLQELGIMPSYSRPRVSDDNAYIESFFRTLKYCPQYPQKGFINIEEARDWLARFMQWYNHEHQHSQINFVTPAQRHYREDAKILEARRRVYEEAKLAHPERWTGKTRSWIYQDAVALNPVKSDELKGLVAA